MINKQFTPTLSPMQIEQIVRWRCAGMSIKVIARRLGCTPGQVMHYWRESALYHGISSKQRRKRQRTEQLFNARATAERRQNAIELADAKRWLAIEIEAARVEIEMKTAPAYKPTMTAMGVGVEQRGPTISRI